MVEATALDRSYGRVVVLTRRGGALVPAPGAIIRVYQVGTSFPYGGFLYDSATSLIPLVFPTQATEDGELDLWSDVPVRIDIEAETSIDGIRRETIDIEPVPVVGLSPSLGDDRYVNVIGDTMSGDLLITPGSADVLRLAYHGLYATPSGKSYPALSVRGTGGGGEIGFGSGNSSLDTYLQYDGVGSLFLGGSLSISDTLRVDDNLIFGGNNVAQIGRIRFRNYDGISWRNVDASADLTLTVDYTNALVFDGAPVFPTLLETPGVSAAEGPKNTFTLGVVVSPDSGNVLEKRVNGLFSSGASVDAYTKPESDAKFVDVAGDTMTAPLSINSGTGAALATVGTLRLKNGSTIAWRDFADSGNMVVGLDASNRLCYNSEPLIGKNTTDTLASRITTLEGQVATLITQMAGHTHTSGTIDVMGGAAVMP